MKQSDVNGVDASDMVLVLEKQKNRNQYLESEKNTTVDYTPPKN